MKKTDFDAFVNSQNRTSSIDWTQRLTDWQEALRLLKAEVAQYLQPYVDGQTATISYTSRYISEEYVGSYEVEIINVSIGHSRVVLEPKGMNIIGAEGRVDMRGPKGLVRLIYIDTNKISDSTCAKDTTRNLIWAVASSPPQVRYLPLSEQSFFDSIVGVVNGKI